MNILKWCSLLVATVALTACQSGPKSTAESELNSLFGSDKQAMFRSFDMGDQPMEIRDRELATLRVESDTILEYDLELPYDGKTYPARIYYAFDEFGLFEIQVDIPGNNEKLKTDIGEHLTVRFGETADLSDQLIWTTNSPSNRMVEILLSFEEPKSSESFVSLNYLELLESEL